MTIEIGGDQILLPYFTVNIWGDTAFITGGTYADLEDTDVLRDILSQCLAQGTAERHRQRLPSSLSRSGQWTVPKLAFVDMSMEQAVLIRLVRSLSGHCDGRHAGAAGHRRGRPTGSHARWSGRGSSGSSV